MGSCFSSNGKTSKKTIVNNIRVVHQNGYLQIFEDTITVGQVTANLPKHFMCTPAQLLVSGILPLRPDIELKLGQIYFCLPYSTLQFEVSPGDLATMAKKLMSIARNGVLLSKSASGSQDGEYSTLGGVMSPNSAASTYQLRSTKRTKSTKGKNNRYAGCYSSYKVPSEEPSASPYRSSPMRSGSDSPGRSPSRFSDRYVSTEGENVGDLDAASRSPMWKPMLATIREKSINWRSESDLQENRDQIPE